MAEEKLKKYSTYMLPSVVKALKRFALENEHPEYAVIEAALKKNIPERFFENRYAKNQEG